MTIRIRSCVAVGLALLLTALNACGRKTEPLIPDSPRPESVRGVKVASRDTVAFLSWPIPVRNVEGKAMNPADIARFRIYRAEFGHDRKKAKYRLYQEILLADPAPASVRNGMVYWSDADLKYGVTYGYRIRAMSVRGGISNPSEEVRLTPLLSLAIPRGVFAQGGNGSNLVTWETVTTRMNGSSYSGFVGYNVYRGTETGRYDEAPLNREPLRTTTFTDTSVINNKTYYYMVRAVDSPIPPWQESPDSEEASAIPRDLTPPDSPTGLTVVPGVGRAFLTWNENKEQDLAGYLVYRSAKHGRGYERLTDRPIARTTFSDEKAAGGHTYYYIITAVDQSGNESRPSVEKRARIEKFR